jgi:hypothetical protein
MQVYTYSEARQKLSIVLEQAEIMTQGEMLEKFEDPGEFASEMRIATAVKMV